MPKHKGERDDQILGLLQDLLIASLANAGVKQAAIRQIAGCSMDRVSRIARHIEGGRTNGKD